MAWRVGLDGCYSPDGQAFEPPADRFEQVYNHRLLLEGAQALAEAEFDPFEGWPLSTRMYRSLPGTPRELRPLLDHFFAAAFQKVCLTAGNSPAELDLLARRLLEQAGRTGTGVTDRERRIATRLAIDTEGLARVREITPGG